jgi:hypothetical protein
MVALISLFICFPMALEMQRHPCGIIYTKQFADFLRCKQQAEADRHPGELLTLEYVRCAEGEQAGASWLQLVWTSLFSVPADQKYEIGETPVFIHRQSRRGLKNRLLHFVNGEVLVKP